MNPAEDDSEITEFVQGDVVRARQIRTNLATFARKVDSPEIHKLVSEVLAGRRSFRAVVRTKEFNEVGMRSVADLEKGIARLTDDQRAELWNSALSRNLDRAIGMPQGSVDDVAAMERLRRPKKRTPIDDENEDFSQNTYSE